MWAPPTPGLDCYGKLNYLLKTALISLTICHSCCLFRLLIRSLLRMHVRHPSGVFPSNRHYHNQLLPGASPARQQGLSDHEPLNCYHFPKRSIDCSIPLPTNWRPRVYRGFVRIRVNRPWPSHAGPGDRGQRSGIGCTNDLLSCIDQMFVIRLEEMIKMATNS